VFWSKIWFFLVGVAAALAVSIALTMPRPAQRIQEQVVDPERVTIARASVEMLLRENARKWVDAAAGFARVPAPPAQPSLKLDAVLAAASKPDKIAPQSHETARNTLTYIMSQVSGTQKPEFVIALDAWGRVVARVGVNEKEWGDDMSGYFLVRDALRGYLRDDLWYMDKKLYRVAAAPVIARAPCEDVTGEGLRQTDCYVGAVVLGDEVDLPLARALEERVGSCRPGPDGQTRCEPHVAFFVRDETVAASDSTIIAKEIFDGYSKAKAEAQAKGQDFKAPAPFTVKAANAEYLVAVRPLPGEVAAQDGYYAVFAERSKAVGFMGTLRRVTKDDVGWARFPWIPVAGLFIVAVALGLFLMWWESDKPVRKLVLDAVALGKGDVPKLDEDRHRGKFGSIARSVNIALEKLAREAKASRKDLGAVLGPPPEDGVLGAGARPLPGAVGGGGGSPFAPPPPSDFSFEPPPPANPVPSAPLHLPSTPPPGVRAASEPAVPKGPGFDFDMPPPPPGPGLPPVPAPAALGTPARKPGAFGGPLGDLPPVPPPPSPPPLSPSVGAGGGTPARRTQAVAAPPPPPLPPVTPVPPAPPPERAGSRGVAPPVPALPQLDDDILAPALDDDMLDAASLTPPPAKGGDFGGATVVADPSEELLKASADGEAAYFREVYEDFLELKRKCGEPIDNLTYEKFAAKLRANRDALMGKYNCKSVKFQVYVKDGKAALKATPVKA
jgi:hypothetical protein